MLQVCNYAEAIVEQLNRRRSSGASTSPPYAIATEHAHSCCILIARSDRFRVDGEWHTWIDYDRFDELVAGCHDAADAIAAEKEQQESQAVGDSAVAAVAKTTIAKKYAARLATAAASFCSTDYMAKTPAWALYNSSERGFDPAEQRFRRNKAGVLVPNEYRPSGSGCG